MLSAVVGLAYRGVMEVTSRAGEREYSFEQAPFCAGPPQLADR
jgi:hypothetical protein